MSIRISNSPPQTFASPIDKAKCLDFREGSALVKMSAIMSSVGHYVNLILPSSTAYWMKWYWMLMCLVLAWKWSSLVRVIVDWILELIWISVVMGTNISNKRFLNHMASLATCVSAMEVITVPHPFLEDCWDSWWDLMIPQNPNFTWGFSQLVPVDSGIVP